MQDGDHIVSGLTVAVMAGGQSRRMGSDKAELSVHGMRMLEHAVAVAVAAGLPTIVVGRARPDWWTLDAVHFHEDDAPGLGPLGGIATALRSAGGPVLAMACDMPLMTSDALRWLAAQATAMHGDAGLSSAATATDESSANAPGTNSRGNDGVLVLNGDRAEPLFSVYAPSCLGVIAALLAEGRLAIRELVERGRFARVPLPPRLAPALRNINTAADLAALR